MIRLRAFIVLLLAAGPAVADRPVQPPSPPGLEQPAAATVPGSRVIRATVVRLRAAVASTEQAIALASNEAERGLLTVRLERLRMVLARAAAVERGLRRHPRRR